MKNYHMKLARAAMTLLLLLVTTTALAQNKYVLAYTPDPNFANQYHIPGQEFTNYGYHTYQETRGEAITVMGCPIWTGHTFTHWFAYWYKQDGTFAYCNFNKDDVIPAAITNEISTDNAVLTLQAVFVENDYTLTFDANGGTGAEMADMPMTYNHSYTLPANTYSKSGAVFMGWTTNADGTGNFFCDGDRVSNMTTEQHGNVTLYAQYLETTGTADDPYLIDNAPTWNILAGRVNKGIDSYKYYKMTADIGTGRMMGTTAHPFNGHFDGNGHSLRGEFSLSYDEIENDTYAPFKYVKNATFINLRITSYIYVNGYKPCGVSAGGCVGAVMPQGNVNFVACHSSARCSFAWSSNNNGDMRGGSFGGFISFLSANSSATFLDCLSSAEAYWFPYQVGYFIGVAEGGSYATFTNCFESTEKFPFQYYDGEVTKRIYVPQYPFVALPHFVNETYNNCWRRMCDDCDMLENEPTGTYAHQGTYTNSKNSTTLNSLGNGWVRDRYGVVFPRIPANTNSITISSDIEHGTVASLETAVPGQDVMLSVTPEDGYHITSVTYNDGSDHDATLRDGKYWFTMPGSNVTVSATFAVDNDAVQYVAYDTESRMYETKYFKRSSVTNVTSSSTNMGTSGQEKKYVVTGDVTVSDRIYVNGTVHLVLADGATLTAEKGVNVHSGNSLIVYGQEGGTGTLNATGCQIMGGDNWESAAIGSDGNGNGNINAYLGDLTFHSGVVNATGYDNAAGIGGGRYNPESGSITIYGGTISAKATNTFNSNPIAQAIGCGASGTIVSKSIADGLRVYTNNSTPPTLVEYAYRPQNGLSQTDVRVERCTEHNYQSGRCIYCGAYEYHQITYIGNGNTSGTAPEVATCNVTMGIHTATGTVAAAGSLERTGYSFAGWNTAADGSGTAYAPDETITLTSSITLYAQWQLVTYTITYDLAGGYEPTIPNPVSYTIESGYITLNNPTRVDTDGTTTTNYLFMGWTGTGLDEATKTVTIPAGSTGDRTYTATWDENEIPFEGIEIDHYPENEADRYYIKMPNPGYKDNVYDENGNIVYDENGEELLFINGAEETPRIVNIPEWFTTAFKVYDDGGKDDKAKDNPSDTHITTLILNAPEGKVFSVQGVLDIGTWYDETDWLKVYDGAGTDNEIHYVVNGSNEIDPFITSVNSIRFDLHIENGHYPSNIDLIVRLTTAPTNITLANDDSQLEQKNTSVIMANDGEYASVTLDGRTLYRNGTWNTLCLPFDIENTEVTLLKGSTVKTLESLTYSDGTLAMNFSDNLTSMEAGKPYIVKWDVNLSYYVIDGSESTETWTMVDYYLIDGYEGLRWAPDTNDGAYCTFGVSGGRQAVTGYTITTGSGDHTPQAWTLEGKMNEGDEWTLVDSRDATTNPSDALPNTDDTPKDYSVTNSGIYRYFRFTVTKGAEEDEYGYSWLNLGELTLQGDYTPDNIVSPTFNYVTIKNETHPFTSGNVTFGGNYSTFASTLGSLFDEHNPDGNALQAYIEAIDGDNVVKWYTDADRTEAHRVTAIPFDATTGNVTLYATWGIADYAITYDLDGGSVATPNPTTYTAETATFTLTNPTRENYVFSGWSGTDIDNASYMVTIAQGSTGDRTYTANWIPTSYGITYNNMENATFDSVTPSFYTIESDNVTLDIPMRDGYTFSGWYTNAELTGDPVTTIAAGSTGDKEFWAKWTATEYYIGYNTNGGAMPNNYTDSYTIESATVTLPTPTRGGYTFAGWYDNAELTGDAVTIIPTGSAGLKTFHAKWTENVLELANSADNNTTIETASASGKTYNVTLANRTLWKDGDWNTLVLPFNLTIAGSPLDGDGVEVRTLSSAGFDDGTLTLYFTPATGEGAVTELVAGTPYIIKWNNTGTHLTQTDLVFSGVTIDATARNQVCEFGDGQSISFVGTYSPVVYNDENKSVLFLGGGNSLYYPDGEAPTTVNACRAYFQLNGITAGDPASGGDVKAFKLNFGDDATGIISIDNGKLKMENEAGAWFDLNGRRLSSKPSARGIYINNGKKIVIK